jgi:glycosyltransferase involved in cell wall biosynthesis
VRVGIYHEPCGGGLGGSEVVTAVIAHALRGRRSVEVMHHHPGLTRDDLARFADVDLDGVGLRPVPRLAKGWTALDAPVWRLGAALREWQAALSRGYDLFVTSTHGVPPFCHAGRGAMYVHFPTFDRRWTWPWDTPGGLRARLRKWYHERLWRQRFAGYGARLANSRFTADWTRERWGVACDVLCPPVHVDVPDGPKRDTIAVVGRFTAMKRQAELVRTFRERVAPRLPGWELVCVGMVGKTPEEQEYFHEVESAAAGGPVRLVTDAAVADLRRVLAEAKVFWHAAGFGIDPRAEPERLEHFGMATVEAMAAGCVPLVPDLGGQREIVRSGEDGFLCRDVGELADETVRLVAAGERLRKLAAAARRRAREFSRERFIDEVRRRLGVDPAA